MQTTFGTFTINFYQNMMTFGSSFPHIKVMKKNSPQKHFFRHKVRHILVKKLLLFTLQMNYIYWKRRTMTVASQRMFGILERWNNNQVAPSLSKPHELSYRSKCLDIYLFEFVNFATMICLLLRRLLDEECQYEGISFSSSQPS